MAIKHALSDVEAGNLIGTFDTEEAALAPGYADLLELGSQLATGDFSVARDLT